MCALRILLHVLQQGAFRHFYATVFVARSRTLGENIHHRPTLTLIDRQMMKGIRRAKPRKKGKKQVLCFLLILARLKDQLASRTSSWDFYRAPRGICRNALYTGCCAFPL